MDAHERVSTRLGGRDVAGVGTMCLDLTSVSDMSMLAPVRTVRTPFGDRPTVDVH